MQVDDACFAAEPAFRGLCLQAFYAGAERVPHARAAAAVLPLGGDGNVAAARGGDAEAGVLFPSGTRRGTRRRQQCARAANRAKTYCTW